MNNLLVISTIRITVAAALFTGQSVFATKSEPYVLPFTPSTNVLARRLVTEHFEFVYNLKGVDPEVLKSFYDKVPQSSIAVGKQAFNETDIVDPAARPRRFNFAGHKSDLWFIVYEVGASRAYHRTILFFQRDARGWKRGPAAVGIMDRSDFSSLVKALRKGWFTVDRDDLNL